MDKLNLEKLSESEVKSLIASEKNPTSPLTYDEVYNQIVGKILFDSNTAHCEIKDKSRNIIYDFLMHTTPIETRFTIGLRFISVPFHLIRLDFGDTLRHTNNMGQPNEKTIIGSHAHIYAPSDKYIKKNVIPISDIDEFKNLKLIKEVFLKFIDYTKIKR